LAVRIRLTRVGHEAASYRLVVADSRSARDGRSIARSATTPAQRAIELSIDAEKASRWLAKGAKPTETVARLFRRAGILPDLG
jgi:small subunit ribosomal protein S16